jgi:hypothetical protein
MSYTVTSHTSNISDIQELNVTYGYLIDSKKWKK